MRQRAIGARQDDPRKEQITMDSPFIIPLAAFALVVLIIAIVHFAKIRDQEIDVHQRLRIEELDHARKMKDLEDELARIKAGK